MDPGATEITGKVSLNPFLRPPFLWWGYALGGGSRCHHAGAGRRSRCWLRRAGLTQTVEIAGRGGGCGERLSGPKNAIRRDYRWCSRGANAINEEVHPTLKTIGSTGAPQTA
jgi:hypothetical protein